MEADAVVNRCANRRSVNNSMRDGILLELFKKGLPYFLAEMQEAGHWGGWDETCRMMIVRFPEWISLALADATKRWARASKWLAHYPWHGSEDLKQDFCLGSPIRMACSANSWGKGDREKVIPNELIAGYATGYIQILESIRMELESLHMQAGGMADYPSWPLPPALRRRYGIFAFGCDIALTDEKKNELHMEIIRGRYGADNVVLHESKWCPVDDLHGGRHAPVAVSSLVDLFSPNFKDKRTAAAAVSRCVTKMAGNGLITKRAGAGGRLWSMTALANLTAKGYGLAVELAIKAGLIGDRPESGPAPAED